VRTKVDVEYHTVTIEPPNERRVYWLAVCSYGDMAISYRNRVESLEAAYAHIREKSLEAALASGEYRFDDSDIKEPSQAMKVIMRSPLEIE